MLFILKYGIINVTSNAYHNLSETIKKDLHECKVAMQNVSAEFRRIAEKNYGTLMSTSWRLFLTVVHLIALHGDSVMPVVLAMHEYSWYVKEGQEWISTPFFDTANGNYMCLSVKPIVFNISVTLHLLSHVQYMQEGTFVIEMMNQYNDTDHSIGEIAYTPTTATGTKLINIEAQPEVIGNIKYNIFTNQENIVYLYEDVVYFRVSFVNST